MSFSRSTLLVVAFVLVDLLVVVAAYVLTHREADVAGPSVRVGSAFTQPTAPISGPLSLAASRDGALLRATRGSCDSRDPERARVWTSTGLRTALVARRVSGLQEVLGSAYDGTTVRIVGAGRDCKVAGFVSNDSGATWRRTDLPRNVWWLDTDSTSTQLHGPVAGGTVSLECAPTSVTTVSATSALATCLDRGVVTVEDRKVSGSQTLGTAAVVAAIPGSSLAAPVGLLSSPSCSAQLVRSTGGSRPRDLGCLSSRGAGLGLAGGGGQTFVQAGYELLVGRLGSELRAYPNDPVAKAARQQSGS